MTIISPILSHTAYFSSRGTKHAWLYSDLLQGLSGEPFTAVFSGGDLNFCVLSTPPLECRMFSIAAVIVWVS